MNGKIYKKKGDVEKFSEEQQIYADILELIR